MNSIYIIVISIEQVLFREVSVQDIPFLAKIRSEKPEFEEYWNQRISGYLACTHNPQQALKPRIIYIAYIDKEIVGFVAGHLTRRLECEGELEWIDVIEGYRRTGIASELVRILAEWFVVQNVHKICVDPGNDNARLFYKMNGAEMLNNHWMFWKDIRTILKEPS